MSKPIFAFKKLKSSENSLRKNKRTIGQNPILFLAFAQEITQILSQKLKKDPWVLLTPVGINPDSDS
ncbi:MAG TPA: hypothetical protein VFH42_01490 [Sporolactobacillaceae bacterium]|nr:hypothetical protein [Sporolactobacillaceae bacterium]